MSVKTETNTGPICQFTCNWQTFLFKNVNLVINAHVYESRWVFLNYIFDNYNKFYCNTPTNRLKN